MNYNEYKEYMEAGELEESELVKLYLAEASKHQKYIKTLKAHNAPVEAIEKQEHEKGYWIWAAILLAEDEKKQGWKYIEDGEKVRPMLEQLLEDIIRAKRMRGEEVGT